MLTEKLLRKKELLLPRIRLICVIGIDGSGKTTHTQKLLGAIVNSAKTRYVWFGSAYFLSYPFMAFCRLFGFTKTYILASNGDHTEHQYYRNKCIAFLWPWVQLIDTLIFVTLKIYIPLRRGYLLVLDRFVHDILVDLMVDVNDFNLHKSFVGQLMLRLIPAGAITFLFDLDEQNALQRKVDIPNSRYLTVRRKYYRSIAHRLKMVRIDSSCSISLVHDCLLKKLKEQRDMLASEHIEKQLRNRLYARARWKKWKKGPIAILKRFVKRRLYHVIGARLGAVEAENSHDIGKDEFGRNLGHCVRSYIDLLRRRGLEIHTVVLVGSRAKNRWKPKSDLDIIVIASRLPKGLMMRLSRYTVLSDIPLFLGIEPCGCTKEEFLERLKDLDLMALDAVCCGKILFDDGFWSQVKRDFKKIEDEYCLATRKLELKLSMI